MSGIFFKSVYFELATLASYLNGIVLMLNSAIFFMIIHKFSIENIKFWMRFFDIFLFLCLIIGFLQCFDLITIEGARTNGNNELSNLLFLPKRATSIFSEPSAWSHLYGIYMLIGYFMGYNWKIIVIVFLSLLLSLSNSGFVFIVFIFLFSLFRKPITKIKFLLLVMVIFGSIGLLILIQPYWDLIFFKFTDKDAYRNIAPYMVAGAFFNQLDIKMLFGHGIYSLKYITTQLDLPENIPTSHNSFIDSLFELGFFGLFSQLILLIKTFGHDILLLALMIILLSQTGYRSYQFPFLYFIYSVYLHNRKALKFNFV
jgi:hypothetical protein